MTQVELWEYLLWSAGGMVLYCSGEAWQQVAGIGARSQMRDHSLNCKLEAERANWMSW